MFFFFLQKSCALYIKFKLYFTFNFNNIKVHVFFSIPPTARHIVNLLCSKLFLYCSFMIMHKECHFSCTSLVPTYLKSSKYSRFSIGNKKSELISQFRHPVFKVENEKLGHLNCLTHFLSVAYLRKKSKNEINIVFVIFSYGRNRSNFSNFGVLQISQTQDIFNFD